MSKNKLNRITISSRENFRPDIPNSGESIANRILLQSGFKEGVTALVKLSKGKLTIKFPNVIDKRMRGYEKFY
jgi:hypothetical protein